MATMNASRAPEGSGDVFAPRSKEQRKAFLNDLAKVRREIFLSNIRMMLLAGICLILGLMVGVGIEKNKSTLPSDYNCQLLAQYSAALADPANYTGPGINKFMGPEEIKARIKELAPQCGATMRLNP